MDQVHENIDNAKKPLYTAFENAAFLLCQNIRQKIEWNIEIFLPGTPATNVMHVCCRKESKKKKVKITCPCCT